MVTIWNIQVCIQTWVLLKGSPLKQTSGEVWQQKWGPKEIPWCSWVSCRGSLHTGHCRWRVPTGTSQKDPHKHSHRTEEAHFCPKVETLPSSLLSPFCAQRSQGQHSNCSEQEEIQKGHSKKPNSTHPLPDSQSWDWAEGGEMFKPNEKWKA